MNPIRALLNWYHRQNIRLQIAVAIIGSAGLIGAAIVQGVFQFLSARAKGNSQNDTRKERMVQQAPGIQVGRDLSIGNLNFQGNVGQVLISPPPTDFVPFNNDLRKEAITKLEAARANSKSLNIVVAVEKGSSIRRKMASEIVELLSSSGYSAQEQAGTANFYSADSAPIKAIFNSNNEQTVFALLRAFEPILKANISVQSVDHRNPPDELLLILREDAKFLANGRAVFD